jgi:L-lactate dehydrogenase (cytochrome)
MKPEEVRDTLRLRRVEWNRNDRVLARAHDIDDFRTEAKRVLPKAVFDYLEGGADEETTTQANREAFRQWQFHPAALTDVSTVDLTTSFVGHDLALPLALAPTGYTRMFDSEGEVAVARAANRAGVPYTMSTVATCTVEQIAATGHRNLWMQLYLFRDRELSWALLDRAWKSGVRTLEFSVDTAVSGRRVRDQRNGLTIPPSLTPMAIAEMGLHPRYWTSMLRAPALRFANFDQAGDEATIASITSQFDSALTWSDVRAVRDIWKGTLALKGPLSAEDAKRAVADGVDVIHLSNHGGRQLDRCVPPIELVSPVRAAVGTTPIIVDSGVRHGMDIAIALAHGADLVAIGRPYLYGLAAAGEAGVSRVIEVFAEQLQRTMQLLGVTTIAQLRERGKDLVQR